MASYRKGAKQGKKPERHKAWQGKTEQKRDPWKKARRNKEVHVRPTFTANGSPTQTKQEVLVRGEERVDWKMEEKRCFYFSFI